MGFRFISQPDYTRFAVLALAGVFALLHSPDRTDSSVQKFPARARIRSRE
jgi:uncharacterized membrane protein